MKLYLWLKNVLQIILAAGFESGETGKTMSTPQDPYFSLKWDNFVPNICCFFHDLREEKDFSDVTLACGDQQVEAHKVILAASSPFFSSILKKNQHTHPLIYLKGIKFSILEALLKFIYQGEVTVHQDNLEAFFTAAEELKVKGLTPGKNFDGDSSSNEQPHTGPTSTIALPTTAPALPQYSAQMLGNFQAGAGGTMPVQNNNTDSEMPVKKEPESVQLEDNSNLPGERRPDPESYDHYQEQRSQMCFNNTCLRSWKDVRRMHIQAIVQKPVICCRFMDS